MAHARPWLSLALSAGLALSSLALTLGARADAVGPPPASCPPGSTPSSSHAGPLCSPNPECSPSAMCTGGTACTTVMQCIEQRDCGGLRPPDSGPCFVSNVVGPCGAGGTCALGTCQTRDVCTTGTAGGGGGCSCAAAGTSRDSACLVLVALALLAAAGSTRRRR